MPINPIPKPMTTELSKSSNICSLEDNKDKMPLHPINPELTMLCRSIVDRSNIQNQIRQLVQSNSYETLVKTP